MADATRIGHVFHNLLSNALRFTAEHGRVEVQVEETSNGTVQFAVIDDGKGIPRQYVSRVFDKFFRVPGQPGDSGTGLGLAIVQSVISDHHGRISVESEKSRGTTFRIELYGTPSDR